MFTKYRTYTDNELYKELSIHVDFRAGTQETMCLQLLEEIKNRMPNWIDLCPVYRGSGTPVLAQKK